MITGEAEFPCGFCGEDASDGVVLDVLAGPGPRGLSQWSAVATRTDGYAVCAVCLFSEAGKQLRAIIGDPEARTVGSLCEVRCTRARHRGKRSRARCPECYGPVSVEHPSVSAPRPGWRERIKAAVRTG